MQRKNKIITIILVIFIISLLVVDSYSIGLMNSSSAIKTTPITPITNSGTFTESLILNEWPHGTQNATDATVGFWFNGWGWASILGTDDCINASSAIDYYASANITDVPTVAYLYAHQDSGSAVEILSSDSELALHYPHDWNTSQFINYSEAIQLAEEGKNFMDYYTYASKWDSPGNGGKGHTFISMANPGDEATIPMLAALWEYAGIRMDGSASCLNSTMLGSWYSTGNYQPVAPFSLMNIDRQICADHYCNWSSLMNIANLASSQHGVVTIYGHPDKLIKIPEFLHWLVR